MEYMSSNPLWTKILGWVLSKFIMTSKAPIFKNLESRWMALEIIKEWQNFRLSIGLEYTVGVCTGIFSILSFLENCYWEIWIKCLVSTSSSESIFAGLPFSRLIAVTLKRQNIIVSTSCILCMHAEPIQTNWKTNTFQIHIGSIRLTKCGN